MMETGTAVAAGTALTTSKLTQSRHTKKWRKGAAGVIQPTAVLT